MKICLKGFTSVFLSRETLFFVDAQRHDFVIKCCTVLPLTASLVVSWPNGVRFECPLTKNSQFILCTCNCNCSIGKHYACSDRRATTTCFDLCPISFNDHAGNRKSSTRRCFIAFDYACCQPQFAWFRDAAIAQ